jgi:hypothetical protein
MDDWSLALLSCKLSMIGVNTGGVIKQQGAPSDYAYILLGGAAKVSLFTLWASLRELSAVFVVSERGVVSRLSACSSHSSP